MQFCKVKETWCILFTFKQASPLIRKKYSSINIPKCGWGTGTVVAGRNVEIVSDSLDDVDVGIEIVLVVLIEIAVHSNTCMYNYILMIACIRMH